MKVMMIPVVLLIALFPNLTAAEVRKYVQTLDVVATEEGEGRTSKDPGNLFEIVYTVDLDEQVITRKYLRRMDKPAGQTIDDNTVYRVLEVRTLYESDSGPGGEVIIAIGISGEMIEILEMGDDFLLAARTSPFSQMLMSVYRRARE